MQLELFAPAVRCQHCGKPTYSPHYETRHIGRSTTQFAFCNQAHAVEYYLAKQREYDGVI